VGRAALLAESAVGEDPGLSSPQALKAASASIAVNANAQRMTRAAWCAARPQCLRPTNGIVSSGFNTCAPFEESTLR
jgi:hypothetical protein